MFKVGQCIAGILAFKDGSPSSYWRPYLIVGVDVERKEIKILNISSIAGKEHKLHFSSNLALPNSMPPLARLSFAKIDSLQVISFEHANGFDLLSYGALISQGDLDAVLNALGVQI